MRSLRACLAVIGLQVLLTTYGSAVVPTNFAYRTGTNFYVNGVEYHYGGDNIYWLGLSVMGTTQAEADSETTNCQNAGIKVIRIWAFSDGKPASFQPSLGVYSDVNLRTLDYAIQDAAMHGEKVILTLTNYWSAFGGMGWYVTQILGGKANQDQFYTDPTCQQYYKQYVSNLINRTNYYTGVQYKNDPAIFSWELANEPRCTSDTTGTNLYNWIHTMAAYIKSLDPNHMVSTGEEGFKLNGNPTDWADNGKEGVDFLRNTADPNIDFATVHLYPLTWHKDNTWVQYFLSDRASIAKTTNGKPIILEEFGEARPTTTDFNTWIGYAEADDYNGIHPWQDVDVLIDNSYDFLFTSSIGAVINTMCAYQNAR